jgi:hypothetical protein
MILPSTDREERFREKKEVFGTAAEGLTNGAVKKTTLECCLFLNVYGAQEMIPRNEFRQPM